MCGYNDLDRYHGNKISPSVPYVSNYVKYNRYSKVDVESFY